MTRKTWDVKTYKELVNKEIKAFLVCVAIHKEKIYHDTIEIILLKLVLCNDITLHRTTQLKLDKTKICYFLCGLS